MSGKDINSETTEIIKKIHDFEINKEINKFFLILFIAGYIGILSSFIEYFFHYFYELDVTFYIFQDIGSHSILSISSQPLLFIIIWSLHVLPLFGIILYNSEKTGLIDFTRVYKKIFILAVFLFIVAELGVLFFSNDNLKVIPIIWGFAIAIGLSITGYLFYRNFSIRLIAYTMYLCSILIVVEVFAVVLFVNDNYSGPTIITFSIGMMLIIVSILTYFLKSTNIIKIDINYQTLNEHEVVSEEENIQKNLEIINNHLKNTIGISEGELFNYMNECRAIMSKKTQIHKG